MFSDELRSVGARVVHNAPGDLLAIGADNRDNITVIKFVFDTRDSRVQQARILLGNGVQGALVDVDASRHRRGESNPPAFTRQRFRLADEQRAVVLAIQDLGEDARLQSVCNDRHSPRIHGDARGLNLRRHAAAPARGFASGQPLDLRRHFMNLRNEFRLRTFARILRKQPVDIRQEDQHRGFELAHHQSAELVIVSKTGAAIGDLEFGGRDGVVLVDDRDHAHIEKRRERVPQVQIALSAREIFFRQQNLGRSQSITGEALFVKIHQAALADGRERLLLRQRRGRGFHFQGVGPKRHGAGRHDDNLTSRQSRGRDIFDERVDAAQGNGAALVEKQVRSKLHDNAFGFAYSVPHTILDSSSSSPGCA